MIYALGPGEVSTYGDIAATAGYPGRARLVGWLLGHRDHDAPWWRVVNSQGRLVPGDEREQAQLLRAEGVTVRDGRVCDAPVGRFRRGRTARRGGPTGAAEPAAPAARRRRR